jgi:hypothetical protein
MALYCRWARIIGIDVLMCRDYDRADAVALCAKTLMMSEEELNNRCDKSVPATNPDPVVIAQIWLQEPHVRRPSLAVHTGGRNWEI